MSAGARLQQKERVDYQSQVLKNLSNWFSAERSHGHEVPPALFRDFYRRFLEQQFAKNKAAQCQLVLDTTALKKQLQDIQAEQSVEANAVVEKASALATKAGQLKQFQKELASRIRQQKGPQELRTCKYISTIAAKLGARLKKTQRKTRLTPEAEHLRVRLGWQSFDRAQHVAVAGTDEELLEQCPNPTLWRIRLRQTVWCFWDHAPVWLRCTGEGNTMVSELETASAQRRKRLSHKTQQELTRYYQACHGDDATEEKQSECEVQLRELLQEAKERSLDSGTERPVQTRGTYSSGGDKFRVTEIFFQSVESWFDPDAAPVGFAEIRSQKDKEMPSLQGILIIHGTVHARLEDIDSEGRWVRDHQFNFKGRLIKRVKGQSTRGLMRNWVKLRNELGFEQFLRLRVWCQPAAWADEIISCWISDLIFMLVFQALCGIDCFTGQWTDCTVQTAWLNFQMQIPFPPETTPMLQPSDTCQIATNKAVGEIVKSELQLQLMEKAKRDGDTYQAKFGPYELFTVAAAMAAEGQKRQSDRDVVLGQMIKSQCMVYRPNADGKLQSIDGQPWALQFPRFPFQSGLQQNWVLSRFSYFDEHSVPPIPDWTVLDDEVFHQDPFQEAVGAEPPLELDVPSAVVMEQLTDADREMLKSPQERWASMALPAQLKSQARKKQSDKKRDRWGKRLSRIFQKGKSKQWQNAREFDKDARPVPSTSKREKKKRKAGDDEASGAPLTKKQYAKLWKGAQCLQGSATAATSKKKDLLTVPDSPWEGVQVRTVDDKLQTCFLNRTWAVTLVQQNQTTGVLHFQLADAKMAVAYCTESQIVRTSDDIGKTQCGPSALDYRLFKKVQREQTAAQLSRDANLIQFGHLIEGQSLAYAVKELEIRLPAAGCRIVLSEEAAAVCAMADDQDELAVVRSELDKYSRVLVLLHSYAPAHYTLLQAVTDASGRVLQYWDSLPCFSKSAHAVAASFCAKLQWQAPPEPCNGRFQPDGWSCGLYSMHFMEEAVREHRGEPLIRKPVNIKDLLTRINKFISQVQPHLPAAAVAAPATSSSSTATAASAAASVASLQKIAEAALEAVPTLDSAPAPSVSEPARPVIFGAAGMGPDASDPEWTSDMAVAAAALHSKCRYKGCTQCMRGWFIPRKLVRSASQERPNNQTKHLRCHPTGQSPPRPPCNGAPWGPHEALD